MDAEEDTQNSPQPPSSGSLSNTHLSRVKFSKEYTATLADEVKITIKIDLRIFSLPLIEKRDHFPF